MTRVDYFKYALTNDLVLELGWHYTFFAILTDKFTGDAYLRPNKDFTKLEVRVKNKWEELQDFGTPTILSLKDKIRVSKDLLENVSKPVESTFGRVILNKILLTNNFGKKLEFINEKTSIGKLEKIIADKLKDDVISVSEYLKFTDAVSFLRGLSRITNVSATYKNVLPPPNIDKIKRELYTEFSKKYGKTWINDRVRLVEFEDRLKKVDEEWLKDDPSNGKLISSKIKNNARAKMYLTFGQTSGFDKSGRNTTFVGNSLLDGSPTTTKEVAAMINSSRSGSYDRGHETQKGGAIAKTLLRAISNYKIVDTDCKTILGKYITVTKDIADALKGRYYLVNGKTKHIDDPSKLIGKTIEIRSPMYCKSPGPTFCKYCMGDNMSLYKDGISLNILNVSNVITTSSLKSMHTSVVNTMKVDIEDMIT